jgi:hypothetical protein
LRNSIQSKLEPEGVILHVWGIQITSVAWVEKCPAMVWLATNIAAMRDLGPLPCGYTLRESLDLSLCPEIAILWHTWTGDWCLAHYNLQLDTCWGAWRYCLHIQGWSPYSGKNLNT